MIMDILTYRRRECRYRDDLRRVIENSRLRCRSGEYNIRREIKLRDLAHSLIEQSRLRQVENEQKFSLTYPG